MLTSREAERAREGSLTLRYSFADETNYTGKL